MSGAATAVSGPEAEVTPFVVTIEAGGHAFTGDEPAGSGGSGLGPSPYQLLAAALGECTAMTVRLYARERSWPLVRVAVEVVHSRRAPKGGNYRTDLFSKKVSLEGDLTEEQIVRLMDVAERCPVQRTLQRGAVIMTAKPPVPAVD